MYYPHHVRLTEYSNVGLGSFYTYFRHFVKTDSPEATVSAVLYSTKPRQLLTCSDATAERRKENLRSKK
jgi:hypothetical protein